MPLDLKDPASGSDYYTAAKAVITQLENNGFDFRGRDAGACTSRTCSRTAAFGGRSATQNIADEYAFYYPDFTSALLDMDFFCSPGVHQIRAVLVLQRPVLLAGGAEHACPRRLQRAAAHAAQALLARGYQFDLNYTFAHSKDHGSAIERGSSFTEFENGGYTGLPDQLVGTRPAVRQFRLRHPPSAERQLGRGAALRPGPEVRQEQLGSRGLDHRRLERGRTVPAHQRPALQRLQLPLLLGDQLEPAGQRVAEGSGPSFRPQGRPRTFSTASRVPSRSRPRRRSSLFRFDYPGEGGTRNILRGDGYFSIDLSVAKAWNMPWSHDQRLWFRWDTFNLTNTPRFDVGNVNMFPDIQTTFGTYDGTYATCDGNAGRCMQFSLRYEF